ncbi:hypothetical protein Mzhil_0186 [Methanosalsum zhilinae DSM 4017]|uniref:Thioredoxin domain-containing protein n=1 Tax=Methanosalsum zhilinae (strain DSM 4017 / NBRC 107636 / OCM 62 / WeN5) TaxID=679901 RepID=F7XNA7_METZD|nr:thioredoxin family protein [Methanosalsum zhilinae]AEH60065.1 hypothetical protein Mzhil_0186 [Methanosalsum zhilinae DSM 4017]
MNRIKRVLKICIVVLLTTIISVSTGGCVEEQADQSVYSEIDSMLEQGTLSITFGAEWCPACQEQKPVIETLSEEYRDSASVIYIDIDQNREIARAFDVFRVPETLVIIEGGNGEYVYMGDAGPTSDPEEAKLRGYAPYQAIDTRIQSAISIRKNEYADN